MTAAEEVLRKAADRLETGGWCQHTSVDREGRYCAAAAIDYATGYDPVDGYDNRMVATGLYDAAMALLAEHVGDPGGIVSWNDAPGRTAEQVIHAMREAAAA